MNGDHETSTHYYRTDLNAWRLIHQPKEEQEAGT